ncbi:MAG: hypothetical protein JO001_07795 [Alphaproteobacteria bacterium]|nr:hypothetical protein [Alphaproteobacteria bacterium]
MSDDRKRPQFRQVVVDLAKLRDYCLSPAHPHGRHKARVFRARLKMEAADADMLRNALLRAAHEDGASFVYRRTDQHGTHYSLDFELSTTAGVAIVRSIWIIAAEQESLRFVTCYLL